MIRVEEGIQNKKHISKPSFDIGLSGRRLQPMAIKSKVAPHKKVLVAFKGANLLHTLQSVLDQNQFSAVSLLVKGEEKTVKDLICNNRLEHDSAIYNQSWTAPQIRRLESVHQNYFKSVPRIIEYLPTQIQTPVKPAKPMKLEHVSI